jgi:hypothetical protein
MVKCFNMYIIKHRDNILIRIAASALACLLAFNDLALASAEGARSTDALAVSSQLANEKFKERFMARASVLGHKAANNAISALIKTDKGIYKDRWEDDMTGELDVADTDVKGNIGFAPAGVKKIRLIKVTGLFKKTGQFAHVGLSGRYEVDGIRHSYGMPVFYVDSFYFDKADKAVLKHEVDEILQWEDLRSVIADARGIDKSEINMRRWIKDHVSREDRKLHGTRYGGKTSIGIAKYIHGKSYPLTGLYRAAGIEAAGALSRLTDMDYIRKIYDIDEEGRDVNIAAGEDGLIPEVLREESRRISVSTPPESIHRRLKFNDVPLGAEMTLVWGENVNGESLEKYYRYLKEKVFPSKEVAAELYFSIALLNITVSTLGISSADIRKNLMPLYVVRQRQNIDQDMEDKIVGRLHVSWKNGDMRERDLPGDITGLLKKIKASFAGPRESGETFSVIIGRLGALADYKEKPVPDIDEPDKAAGGEEAADAGASADRTPHSARSRSKELAKYYGSISDEEAMARITGLAETVKTIAENPKNARAGISQVFIDLEDHARAALLSRLDRKREAFGFMVKICDIYTGVATAGQTARFYDEHYPVYDLFLMISDLKLRHHDFSAALSSAEYGIKRLDKSVALIKRNNQPGAGKAIAEMLAERLIFMMTMAKASLRMGDLEKASRIGNELKGELKKRLDARDVRDISLCGDYCEVMTEIVNSATERIDWEEARRNVEELLLLSQRSNLSFDNRRNVFSDLILAADIYLRGRGLFRDIDCLLAAKRCVGLAEEAIPLSREAAVLRAWIMFEEGDMAGVESELKKVQDILGMNSRCSVLFIRLSKALAVSLRNGGMEDAAREVCARAESHMAGLSSSSAGKRALLNGFLIVTKGYDAALEDMRSILDESRKGGGYLISALMSHAVASIARAISKSERISLYCGPGRINDYALSCLEALEQGDISSRVIESDTRINPVEIKNGIVTVMKMMLEEDGDPRISRRIKYRILWFMEYLRKRNESPVWIIERLEKLLSEKDRPREADTETGNGRNKDKRAAENERAALEAKIKEFIKYETLFCRAGDRMDRAKKMFGDGAYEKALEEAEAGLKTADESDEDGLKDRLSTYKEAASCMIRANSSYVAQRFGMARLQYEKAMRALGTAGAAPGDALSDGLVRARKMAQAEEAYESGDFDGALRIAGEVNDAPGNGFAQKVMKVRRAESGPNPGIVMGRLMNEFPADTRIRAFLSTHRAAARENKTRLSAANDLMRDVAKILSMPDITRDDILTALGELRKARQTGGYSNWFGNLVRDTAKTAYARGIYRLALLTAEFGLSAVPQDSRRIRDELLVVARDAKAQMASAKLHRQYEILDCHFQADNLRTKKKLSERGTLDYKFSTIKKNEDGATLEISGLSYAKADGAATDIKDARTAVSRGESYVLITENSEGRMVQFVIKAVSVYGPGENPEEKSRAVFKLECNETSQSAFAAILERPGVLKKLNDPSLKDRRDAVFECMTQLDNSLALGEKPTSGSRFADMLLELDPPAGDDVKQANIDFRDERLAKDENQRKAVEASLDSEIRTTLIQGPPGTGKTSVIVEIIRQFRARGKKILVVSQSNAAVDNIAKRLIAVQSEGETLAFARVGNNRDAIDPDVYKSEAYSNKKKVLEEMRAARAGCVVLGTIGGFSSDSDMKKMEEYYSKFDLVIVEEAGRATLAETLVPIGRASPTGKVVLVGDHNQLPPYGIDETQIEETKEELEKYMYKKDRLGEIFSAGKIREFKTSPFEILWEHARGFKEGVHRHFLAINRRSHPLIAGLVSKLFYQEKIKTDPEKSDNPEEDTIKLIDYTEDEPLAERGGNYRSLYESRAGKSYNNLREVNILLDEFDRVLNQKKYGSYRYDIKDITIITPFAPQRALIKEAFEVKALINKLLKGGEAGETAIAERDRDLLVAALKPGSSEAAAAIGTLANSNPAGEARERLVRKIASALIFDVPSKHGERSVMPEDLEKLGLLEIETVDSIQGSENKVVILSLVRSNTIGGIGFMGTGDGLQRLNVAFSRAQEKFVIIGDFTNTLTQARYTPSNPNPRSWFQRARRESTGRAQIVFKKTLEYCNVLRRSPIAPAGAPSAPAKISDKGSPAKLLEVIRDNLMERAVSGEGFVFEDAARLRNYHASTVYKEIQILSDLGVLERVKDGASSRLRFAGKIRSLGAGRIPALIDSILATEYRIGNTGKPLDRYEIPDRRDLDAVRELINNTVGIESARCLAELPAPGAEDGGRYYVVRYNDEKLAEYARRLGIAESTFRDIMKMYVRFLRLRLGGSDRVDEPKPTGGARQPLISIECHNSAARTEATLIGRARVSLDGDLPEKGAALRIIDMANMAFAISNIPLGTKNGQADGYSSYISFARSLYKELTGRDIPPEEMLKDDRLITLPAIRPMALDKLPEYYELTVKQLAQAA